jgi:small subunit ribosomal protein S1
MVNNPWSDAENRYKRGSLLRARVSALTSYGCYLELDDGIEGLLRTGPEGIAALHFQVGDEVNVVVVEIDAKRRLLGFGLVYR